MRKQIFRFALCMIVVLSLFVSFGVSAFAQTDYVTVTLQKGDTAYTLCKDRGLNFYEEKALIMSLNGMTQESELSQLRAGSTLKLPSKNSSVSTKASNVGDCVEYYVVPYVIEKGDTIAHVYWLWGLTFEPYADAIRSLNGVENLDLLYVGAIYLLPTTEAKPKTEIYTTVMAHIMKPGETAYDIITGYGVDYYGKLKALQNYNGGADLTKISAGEKLLIPLI